MPRDSDEPVYMIGVAARLVDCHPQTLRMYERLGLVSPTRTDTNLRLYSDTDIAKLQQIQRLTQELGVNLAGVGVILDLLEKLQDMREEMEQEVERVQCDATDEIRRLRSRLREAGLEIEVEPDQGSPSGPPAGEEGESS
ncbi:MAG: MerR family transcriptional regulator [Armatimonadia bacterium]|nr:MerR family transcriptional regulator [Armatimonadia bacterium]